MQYQIDLISVRCQPCIAIIRRSSMIKLAGKAKTGERCRRPGLWGWHQRHKQMIPASIVNKFSDHNSLPSLFFVLVINCNKFIVAIFKKE